MGELPIQPLPSRGPQRCKAGGQSQQWPTNGQIGYLTLAVWGLPNASERGGKSAARKWANRVQNPRTPAVEGVLNPSERGTKSVVATNEQIGYMTPAISEVPNTSERGAKSALAHKWSNWLHHPCRLRGPQCFEPGDKISGPQMGKLPA